MSTLEDFRRETRAWLEANCPPAMRTAMPDGELVWGGRKLEFKNEDQRLWFERMRDKGWFCPDWPAAYGGGGLSPEQNAVLESEMRRLHCRPPQINLGIWMLGPVVLEFGTEEQKRELLPPMARGEMRWCQGFSEPNAGSDLANVKTRAVLENGKWRINGQKVWTSLAHESDWCFVIARTEPGSVGHQGLSFLLVPMAQAGITVRPIEQLTGTSEFNEVFFDDAETDANNLLGAPGDGWKIAMALLGFERGVSTLGQQMLFHNELEEIIRIAKSNGAARDPLLRQRIAQAWSGLRILRYNSLRMLSGGQDAALRREAMIYKLCWANWHVELGKLAMDVLGADAELLEDAPYQLGRLQAMFLFSRSDSIYGGTNEIQRNIIAERALGMPREPRVRA